MEWIGVGFLAVCALLGARGKSVWPFELLLSVAPQQALTCALYAWLMAALGNVPAGAAALTLVGVNLWTARGMFVRRTPPLPARTMRLVWCNVWGKPEALARVFRLAEQRDADVVVIGEFPYPLSTGERRELERGYRHFAGAVGDPTINVALFSRTPLTHVEPIALEALPFRRSLEVTIGDLRVIAIHPKVPYTARMTGERNAMLAAAFARAEDRAAAVMVGDFNTVSWSPVLGALAARARSVAWGLRATWVTTLAPFGLPIDHVFAFGRARASARLGPFVGSDHYPVIVDVLLD